MVLILSEDNDLSTIEVIEWLEFYGVKWVKITKEDEFKLNFIGDDINFKSKRYNFNISDIKSFWFRRGYLNVKFIPTSILELNEFLLTEFTDCVDYIYYVLQQKTHLNSINKANVNKLIVNKIANILDIKTPEEYVFSSLPALKNKLSKDIQYITKTISGSAMQVFEDFTIYNYTTLLKMDEINNDFFFPSLVQVKIEKKFELRIFYLDGEFYPMAILSQKDEQTSLDFRNYNKKKPNRKVPFRLPKVIEVKLNALMKRVDLNCGSIDMIVTKKNEYVFLEVNPVGQFGMTSFPCNYNLEKKIANYLVYEYRKN